MSNKTVNRIKTYLLGRNNIRQSNSKHKNVLFIRVT